MAKHNNSSYAVLLFFVGLFYQTEVRVVGSIGISELVMFIVAPFIFLSQIYFLKRDGFMTFLFLVLLAVAGSYISSFVNHTPTPFLLKGCAEVYSLFAITVCLHALLRFNFRSLRWLILGQAISSILCIFIFQRGATRQIGDDAFMSAEAMEATLSYAIFWVLMAKQWLYVPIEGWYEHVKKWYVIVASGVIIFLGMFCSGASGRSNTVCAGVSAILLLFGSAHRKGLSFVRRHIVLLLILLAGCAMGYKFIYSELAQNGTLGEAALTKYENQTKRGKGTLALLMGGRVDFFAGLFACLQKPIEGYGAWAVDHDGIYGEFLSRYGMEGDYENYVKNMSQSWLANGSRLALIPSHSNILQFWLWYGITGLLLWIYILSLVFKTLLKWLSIYPLWYGYLACVMPTFIWNAFFSPFGGRVGIATLITVCLFLKAVAQRRIPAGGIISINGGGHA